MSAAAQIPAHLLERAEAARRAAANATVDEVVVDDVEVTVLDLDVDDIDRFLATKGCTLWGIKKDIVAPKGRREAAEWLFETMDQLLQFLENEQ